ncbi:hypothetical protein, partial [Stutzerimonas kunmingensis]|uniref:hypothetical protein n=1 Tax=Stutzerimonas kunmingensis TaxID=1211807 RepID=UPI00241F2620
PESAKNLFFCGEPVDDNFHSVPEVRTIALLEHWAQYATCATTRLAFRLPVVTTERDAWHRPRCVSMD